MDPDFRTSGLVGESAAPAARPRGASVRSERGLDARKRRRRRLMNFTPRLASSRSKMIYMSDHQSSGIRSFRSSSVTIFAYWAKVPRTAGGRSSAQSGARRRSMNFRARVRLAHQFIFGSSVTACHNPPCTIKASRWRVHTYCRRQLRQSYPRTRRPLPQPRRGRGNC
jgi:hypothetical protein